MYNDSSMRSQLSKLKDKIKPDRIKDPSPSPMNWEADGVDHINIWEFGNTEVGKFLAHNSPHSFRHHLFSKFANMGCFWHYIQSEERDDRVRVLSGKSLKQFSKKLTSTKVVNFRAIIMDSNWQKIQQHPDYMMKIKESELPFDCYYCSKKSKIRIRPTFFKWLIMGFEEIRLALKEGREPDFTFIMDNKNSGIYDFAIPEMGGVTKSSNSESDEKLAEVLESDLSDSE